MKTATEFINVYLNMPENERSKIDAWFLSSKALDANISAAYHAGAFDEARSQANKAYGEGSCRDTAELY